MGRRPKKTLLPGLPECTKPLDTNKHVSMYIATHCTEGTSNKVYIFVIASHKKKQYLARFWGKYGGTLTGTYDTYDQNTFQKLIDEKGTEGYRIVDNTTIAASEHVWGPYAEKISDFVNTLVAKCEPGIKITLS
jgi:hypothetical protein